MYSGLRAVKQNNWISLYDNEIFNKEQFSDFRSFQIVNLSKDLYQLVREFVVKRRQKFTIRFRGN